MRAKTLFAAIVISSAVVVSPIEGAQRQRWPGGESRGNGNGGGNGAGQRQGGAGQRQEGGGGGQRQQGGSGQRQAGERRAEPQGGNDNGGGRRDPAGPPPARAAQDRQARPAPQPPVYGQQQDDRRAQSRRPPDLAYVPDIRRGTSERLTNTGPAGAQPRVAVPRPGYSTGSGHYDGNRSSYRVYPGNKYNHYRYYPYKSYGYAGYGRPYYYYPYAFGYGPYGRGLFYFDLYYNSYVFYPPTVARYDNYGSYYGTYGYPTGELRLQVRPPDAQVFINGAYAGTVDNFDGTFQALRLEQGDYKVEIVLPGYEPLDFDVRITPGEKVTYKGDLVPERQPQGFPEPPPQP